MYPSLTPIGSGSIFASSSDCCWECLHLRDPLWDQLVHSLSVSLGVILGLLWAVTQEPLRSQEMDSFRGSVSCRLQSLMGVAEAVCMPLGLRWVWEGVLPWGLGPRSWPIQLRGWLVTHSGPLCSCNQLTQWILGTFIKKKNPLSSCNSCFLSRSGWATPLQCSFVIYVPLFNSPHPPYITHLPPIFMSLKLNPLSPISTAHMHMCIGSSTGTWVAYRWQPHHSYQMLLAPQHPFSLHDGVL